MLLKLKTWYKLHKWLSIFTGLAIIMWLSTGIVITAPGLIPDVYKPSYPEGAITYSLNYEAITLSPADAIKALEAELGQQVIVKTVNLIQVKRTPAYQIILQDRASHLINAESAKIFTITLELAQDLSRDIVKDSIPILDTALLETHDFSYITGPIPAYRIIFDDPQDTYVHISYDTGQAIWNTRSERRNYLFEALHTFEIFSVLLKDETLVAALLWLSIALTILAALMGYYLALPRRVHTVARGR